ncbi:17559_t:CDS:1 [Acaulospora colombiana]|uniref:17559_t:CDS:1 n=1 Tax=Acaulospora colombiana TaxID=27376 RepID=A0ACA9P7W3_9GLOM|nr:17559_t:CDS:1 [Acaulospora colombiana]
MNLSYKYKKYKAYREKSKFVKPVYIEKEITEITYREFHRTLKKFDEATEFKFNNKERTIGSHNILEELSVEITSENEKDITILKEKLTKEFIESKGILRVKLEQIREEIFNETVTSTIEKFMKEKATEQLELKIFRKYFGKEELKLQINTSQYDDPYLDNAQLILGIYDTDRNKYVYIKEELIIEEAFDLITILQKQNILREVIKEKETVIVKVNYLNNKHIFEYIKKIISEKTAGMRINYHRIEMAIVLELSVELTEYKIFLRTKILQQGNSYNNQKLKYPIYFKVSITEEQHKKILANINNMTYNINIQKLQENDNTRKIVKQILKENEYTLKELTTKSELGITFKEELGMVIFNLIEIDNQINDIIFTEKITQQEFKELDFIKEHPTYNCKGMNHSIILVIRGEYRRKRIEKKLTRIIERILKFRKLRKQYGATPEDDTMMRFIIEDLDDEIDINMEDISLEDN